MSISRYLGLTLNTEYDLRPEERPEIARLPIFSDMDETLRDSIFSASLLQAFPRQLVLFEVGQRADFLHILVDGLVELFTSNGDRDTSMVIVTPGHSFILAAAITDMPYLMAARTLSTSRILLVPAPLLRDTIEQDGALNRATMHELAWDYREMVRALTDMKLRQSTERLANHLLLQSRRLGGADCFQLRGEKRLLASLLGMTPENLSRAFGALAQHGIRVDGLTISITDRKAMEGFARPDPFFD